MSNCMKKAFKRGIIKATSTTDSWIITNGYNSGVAKLVGEAIAENFNSSQVLDLAVIGILNSTNVVSIEKLRKLKFEDKVCFYFRIFFLFCFLVESLLNILVGC